jgi:hypothetical protein
MLAAVGVGALLSRAASLFKRGEGLLAPARVVSALLLVVFVALPAWAALKSRPHYALYTNALAARRAGYFFPHDEFYDDGLREALKFVAESAPQGATVVHETPGVTGYYLRRFNRTDIDSRVLSAAQFHLDDAPRPAYFILQRGRTYFENREKMDEVRARFPRVHAVTIDGVAAAEVYEAR